MYKTEDKAEAGITQAECNESLPILKEQEQVWFSLSLARARSVTDAIIYYHLQQAVAGKWNTVNGGARQWVVDHGLGQIMLEVPCFSSRSTVQSSLDRMAADKLIGKAKSGQLRGHPSYDYEAQDYHGAYCVAVTALPDDADLVSIGAEDAKEHGMLKACLLSELDSLVTDKEGYGKLSASALAKELPYNRRNIQVALQEMLKDGWLIRHPTKAKLYKRGEGNAKEAVNEPLMLETLGFF